MRLIKLSANKESFKTVNFNRKGISIIAGKRFGLNDNNSKETYNSLGKSLVISLINFCLGSSANPEFDKKLNDWTFYLEFEIDDVTFISERSCNSQHVLKLNSEEIKLADYNNLLLNKTFKLSDNFKFVSFRTLLPRFIRPTKSSYNSYNEFIKKETDYAKMINNATLLGLDTNLVSKKYELKEKNDEIVSLLDNVQKDPIMKSFFESDDDEDFEIVDLKEKVARLQNNIETFQVAEDYHEIVKEADNLKIEIKSLEKRMGIYKQAISNIEKSLSISPDITKKKILDLYNDANVSLPDLVVKRLDDLELFNKRIVDNRAVRLTSEKRSFEARLNEVNKKVKVLGKLKDAKLEYLNSKGALEEYTKLNQQLSDFKSKLKKLESYKELINEYKNKHEEIKKSFSDENIITNNYLKKNDKIVEDNIRMFKSFAGEFYSNKKAILEIKNNDGINKERFVIKAKIDDDKGDGVNDVKIFCFDWTILLGRHNHNIKFLFHDSRLLSEVDTRQVATLFKVANNYSQKYNLQYIISVNENVLNNLRLELSEKKYEEIIENSIILELTDESAESKLLGIQVDLDYDKE